VTRPSAAGSTSLDPRVEDVGGAAEKAALYRDQRIAYWNDYTRRRSSDYYHRRLAEIYQFLIPPGQRVLELGSGDGDLIASLKPSMGVGVDFSPEMTSRARQRHPEVEFLLQGDAVRAGFAAAEGDVLMILDADLTVAPEDLPRFYEVLRSGKGEFVNGVRLVYPMEAQAMRFFNLIGNKFFAVAFSWLLGQAIKDTLCGTKVLSRQNYDLIVRNRGYFEEFDPFGDFDLIFGAAKLNLKVVDVPIRYAERTYGETNIARWRHGWLLIRMVMFACTRIKFV
jgi:SAM-dependent methyltransferase